MVEDLPERHKEEPKFIESPDILQALKVVFNKAPLAFDRIVSSLIGIKSRSLIRQKTLDGVDCEILEEVKTICSNPRKDETTPTPPPTENIQCLAYGHPTDSGMAAIITNSFFKLFIPP